MSKSQDVEGKASAVYLSYGAVDTILIALGEYRKKIIDAQAMVDLHDTKQSSSLKGLARERRLVEDLQVLIQANDTTDVIVVDRDQ